MSISGNYFKYDNKSSKDYGLIFANIDTEYTGTIVEAKKTYTVSRLPRGSRFYVTGRKCEEPLSREVEIICESPLTDIQKRNITKWLFDRPTNYPLEILSKEYNGMHYNCRFVEQTEHNYGDGNHGWKCTIVCDAPWGWENENTVTYTSNNFVFNNYSDDTDYLTPKLQFTTGSTGGNVTITNITDNNNIIECNNLSANETIIMDILGQVTSSTGLSRTNNFIKHNLLKMVSGENQLLQQAIFLKLK